MSTRPLYLYLWLEHFKDIFNNLLVTHLQYFWLCDVEKSPTHGNSLPPPLSLPISDCEPYGACCSSYISGILLPPQYRKKFPCFHQSNSQGFILHWSYSQDFPPSVCKISRILVLAGAHWCIDHCLKHNNTPCSGNFRTINLKNMWFRKTTTTRSRFNNPTPPPLFHNFLYFDNYNVLNPPKPKNLDTMEIVYPIFQIRLHWK